MESMAMYLTGYHDNMIPWQWIGHMTYRIFCLQCGRCFVKNGLQLLTKSAPVRIEVEE